MTSLQKLLRAHQLLNAELGQLITSSSINYDLERLTLETADGLRIYIQYNNFNEYGYSIFFSAAKNDFCRYDNYDDRWDVRSKPHHFHLRGKKGVKESPMKGNPDLDISILCRAIKTSRF